MTGWKTVHVASLLLGIAVGVCVVTILSTFAQSQRSSYKFYVSSMLGQPKASRAATRKQQALSNGRRDMISDKSTMLNEVVIAKMMSWLDGTVKSPALHYSVPHCQFQGQPLACHFILVGHTKGNHTAERLLDRAAAVFHPRNWTIAALQPEHLRKLPQVFFDMEPVSKLLPMQLAHTADIEMNYQKCAQVWSPYFLHFGWSELGGFPTPCQRLAYLQKPALKFEEKQNAIFWLSTNCRPINKRVKKVQELMAALTNSTIKVHSYGKCLQNVNETERVAIKGHTGDATKTAVSSKYKFCITMENSNIEDYVTEKVYDGLLAGCIPMYWGAPNINDYIPQREAVLHLTDYADMTALVKELEFLAGNKTAYEARLAWKQQKLDQMNPGFQALAGYPNPFCSLCEFVAHQRQHPQVHTKCRDNITYKGIFNSTSSVLHPITAK